MTKCILILIFLSASNFESISQSVPKNPTIRNFRDGFLYSKDRELFYINLNNNSFNLLYKSGEDSKISDFIHNWKRGIIILEDNQQYSRVIQIKDFTNKEKDIIYSADKSNGESHESIQKINVSPTGDFMVLYMGYWESNGLKIVDLRDLSMVEYFPEFGYLSGFIKWLPFNSILASRTEGGELDGYGKWWVYNINLETKQFKEWHLSSGQFKGFVETDDQGLVLLTTPRKNQETPIEGLRLNRFDLREINDTTDRKKLKFELNDKNKIAEIVRIATNSFSCKLKSVNNNEVDFDKPYELSYSHLNWFKFSSLRYDTNEGVLIINFKVAIENKVSRSNYGTVDFHINLSGKLIKKVYNNIDLERKGFDIIKYVHLIDSLSNSIDMYQNDEFVKTFSWDSLPTPIPNEISFN